MHGAQQDLLSADEPLSLTQQDTNRADQHVTWKG
jgi:hypothetical protein